MLLKVNPVRKQTVKITWTSRFIRSLFKICFFPVTIEGDKVFFSWLSLKILVHFALGIGIFFSFMIVSFSSIDFFNTVKKSLSVVSDMIPLFDMNNFSCQAQANPIL